MSIDKDIHQSNFKNQHQRALVNLIFTYNWTTSKLKMLFDKEDLTMQQFNILRIVRGSEKALSTLQIRERMLDKMSDSSRIVDRLVIKGLLKKNISKTDKRLVEVAITERGKRVLKKMDLQEDELHQIVRALSDKEAKTLNKLLDKIRESQ